MLKRVTSVALAVAVAVHVSAACAQTEINSHIIDQQVVERLGTSLNHTSLIELPGPVTAAVIGTEGVRMEFRDNVVIVEPDLPGIQTNLLVWTGGQQLVYEVMPAVETPKYPYVIREVFAAPPLPPPGPTLDEERDSRDSTHGAFLLSLRTIVGCDQTYGKKGAVRLRVEEVGEDHFSHYVRLTAVNRTQHPYRITSPAVRQIVPTFGEKTALSVINEQLTERQFDDLKLYDSKAVVSHGSNLLPRDLKPGASTTWTMGINKVGQSVAMYEFLLPADGVARVHAVVIF